MGRSLDLLDGIGIDIGISIVFTHYMFPIKVLLGDTVEVFRAVMVPFARLMDIVVWTVDSALRG